MVKKQEKDNQKHSSFSLPEPKNGNYYTPPSWEKTDKNTTWKKHYTQEERKLHSSKRWQEFRKIILTETPLCYFCEGLASEVHRIDPKNIDLFFDRDNAVALCSECHSLINSAYKRGIDPQILFKDEPENKENL